MNMSLCTCHFHRQRLWYFPIQTNESQIKKSSLAHLSASSAVPVVERSFNAHRITLESSLPPKVERRLVGRWALDGLPSVGTGYRNSLVLFLTVCRGCVLVDSRDMWRGLSCGRGDEAGALGRHGRGRVGLGGRCLKLEALLSRREGGLGNNETLSTGSEGRGALLDIAQSLVGRGREAGRHGVLGKCRGLGTKARCVRGRLGAKLSQVQIRASLVAHIHRLVELALGPVAVEDDAVQGDADDLDNELNDDDEQMTTII